ncbi:MAG: DUF2067 domain-containing protein [bacterium]|nr:DUF2067 domain-containing protein [bacterium]
MKQDSVRTIAVNIPDYDAAMELLDFIENYDWEKVDVLAEYKVNNIKIKIYGPKPFVKKAYRRVKQFIRIVESRYKKDKHGLYTFYYDDLVLLFGTTFKIELLLDILQDLGYKVVRISEKCFKSSASLSDLEQLVQELVLLKEDARAVAASRPVMELLIRAALCQRRPILDIAEEATELGMLRKNTENRYELAAAPEKFIKKFIRKE